MEKLKSPLNENEFAKIRNYAGKKVVHNANSIEQFKLINPDFSILLVDLTEKEQVRALFYLKNLSKPAVLKSSVKDLNKDELIKKKVGLYFNIVVFLLTLLILVGGYYLFFYESEAEHLRKQQQKLELKKNYIAQISVSKLLKDPYSAKFENMNGFCGWVNSKNSFGAYTGSVRYIGTPDLTLIEGQSIDDATFNEVWNKVCK